MASSGLHSDEEWRKLLLSSQVTLLFVFWWVVSGIGVIDYGRREPTSFVFLKLTQEIGKNPAKSRIVKPGQGGGVWRPIFSAPHRVPTVQKKCSKVSIS